MARRGIAVVFTLLGIAVFVSLAGFALLYLALGREPAVPSNAALVLRVGGEPLCPGERFLTSAARTEPLNGRTKAGAKARRRALAQRFTERRATEPNPIEGGDEAAHIGEQLANDQRRPAISEDLRSAGDGTVLAVLVHGPPRVRQMDWSGPRPESSVGRQTGPDHED